MTAIPKIDSLPRPIRLGLCLAMVMITLAAAAAPFLNFPPVQRPLQSMNRFFYDGFMRHFGSDAPYTHGVTIVDIDETSLAGAGQWPWPRYRLAQMLAILSAHAPRAMGLDIVFPEADRLSLDQLSRQFRSDFKVDIRISNVPETLTDNDGFFGHILGQTRTVGARYYYFDHTTEGEICRDAALNIRLPGGDTDMLSELPRAEGALCNVPKIETRLASAGFINTQYDSDGLVRKTPLLIRYHDRVVPHLSLALFLMELGIPEVKAVSTSTGLALEAGDLRIPITREGYAHMNFTRPAFGFTYISAIDILNRNFDPSKIRGRTVLVGSSAVGLNDIHPTVFDPHFPGIEVSAVLLDNMANNRLIRRPGWAKAAVAAGCLLLGSLLITVFYRNQGPGVLSGVFLAGTAVVCGTSIALYTTGLIFVSPALPLALGAALFVSIAFTRFISEKRAAFMWYRQLSAAQQLTMEIMVNMVETRDPETGEHIVRTQHYARAVALHLRKKGLFTDLLTSEYIETLFLSVPLHDIGKVGIPDKILLKPARLNDDEFRHMKMHATYGRIILRQAAKKIEGSNYLAMAEDIAGTHHEKWDGTGYPERLSGEEIPLSGRIMAIADVYDALISRRCYKPPFPHEKAMGIIREERGKIFDPVIVDAFVEIETTIKEIAEEFGDEE
ncbi:MAG: CHASE2 domain-containing protein [Desulfobacterales bacterium]|nr:CHASE2 domain-containing protein [Desulfobacterales bacterium]